MEILTLHLNAGRKQGLTLGVRMIKLEQTRQTQEKYQPVSVRQPPQPGAASMP